MTKCKRCGAPLIWIRSEGGKWIPCNEGLVEYRAGTSGDFEDRIVTDDGQVLRCTFDFLGTPDGLGHIPHWATCPYAEEFRRGQ